MKRHEVSLVQGVAKVGDITVSGGLHQLALDVGIGDHDVHIECGAAPRHPAADAAESDDEHGFAPEFGQPACVAGVVTAGASQPVHHHHLPGYCDHQTHGLLRHGHRVRLANDSERYAASGQRVDIDIVVPDPVARDDLQPGRHRDRLGPKRRQSKEEAVEVCDARVEIGGRRVAQHRVIDVGPRVQECLGRFVDRAGDQNIRHFMCFPPPKMPCPISIATGGSHFIGSSKFRPVSYRLTKADAARPADGILFRNARDHHHRANMALAAAPVNQRVQQVAHRQPARVARTPGGG